MNFELTMCSRLTKADGSPFGFYFQITATDDYGRRATTGGTFEYCEKCGDEDVRKLAMEHAAKEGWKDKLASMLEQRAEQANAKAKEPPMRVEAKEVSIKERKLEL